MGLVNFLCGQTAEGKGSVWTVAGLCVVLFGLLSVLVWLYNVFLYPYYASPLRQLPTPEDNVIFFGQIPKLLQAQWVPHVFREWSQRWPETPFIRYLGIGGSENLVVNSVPAYHEILRDKDHSFVKPSSTRRYSSLVIGDGLPFAEGHRHRRHKAVMVNAFAAGQVRHMVPDIQAKARQLSRVLTGARDTTGLVEIETRLWKTALDVISIDVLGLDLDHLESSGSSPLYGIFTRTMQQSLWSFIKQNISAHLPLRDLIPTKENRAFQEDCRQSRRFLREHVDARRGRRDDASTEKQTELPDALQGMIDAGDMLTDDEIIEYLLNLLVLGHDTTACALVWAAHVLSTHPEHQQRLRFETNKLLSSNSAPSFEDIEALPFMDNFLREVLRVYCPVPYIPRETSKEVLIDGVLLPKGTVLNLCPAVINSHPLVWGSDAARFDPDRWTDLSGQALAFSVFHGGAHGCLAKQLAITEMKIVLMELVSNFRIEAAGDNKPVEFASPSFTLRPKDRLHVRLMDIDVGVKG